MLISAGLLVRSSCLQNVSPVSVGQRAHARADDDGPPSTTLMRCSRLQAAVGTAGALQLTAGGVGVPSWMMAWGQSRSGGRAAPEAKFINGNIRVGGDYCRSSLLKGDCFAGARHADIAARGRQRRADTYDSGRARIHRRRIRTAASTSRRAPWMTIVGVVGGVADADGARASYYRFRGRRPRAMNVVGCANRLVSQPPHARSE
jgi:hypothetical protein